MWWHFWRKKLIFLAKALNSIVLIYFMFILFESLMSIWWYFMWESRTKLKWKGFIFTKLEMKRILSAYQKWKRFIFFSIRKWKGFRVQMKRNSILKWKGFIFEKCKEKKMKRKLFRPTQKICSVALHFMRQHTVCNT